MERSHVNDGRLRRLGILSLADFRLRKIRDCPDGFPPGQPIASWCEFADYLHELVGQVYTAALESTSPTAPLFVEDRQHRRITMDDHGLDQLTGKVDQHTRLAYLIGFVRPGASDSA